MKKIILFLLVLLLCGCSVEISKTDLPEVTATPETQEESCDPCIMVTDEEPEEKNYIKLLGFDPYLADNVVHGRKDMGNEVDESPYKTVLTGSLYLDVRSGKLSITNIETGKYFVYQHPADFKSLAEYSDCGGIYAYALTTSGNVYEIKVDDLQYLSNFKSEDILNGLIPLNLDMKISALAVKDYKWIHSTCGTFGLYVVDSKSIERSISRKRDESGTVYSVGEPTYKTKYVDYISMNIDETIVGTPESPVKYLLLMLDGTVRIAFDYEENDLRIEETGLKGKEGEIISASQIIKSVNEDGTVTAYIITVDGLLYSYTNDTVSEIGQCVALINQYRKDYPNRPVQIVLESGEIIEISIEE